MLAARRTAGLVGWGERACAEGEAAPAGEVAPIEEHGRWWHTDNYRASWRWHQYHPGCSEEDAKEYYRSWAEYERWRRRQQDRFRRDWDRAKREQRAAEHLRQAAEDAEAAAFRAELDAALRVSLVTVGGAAGAGDVAEAEMVQDALRAAGEAEEASRAAAEAACFICLENTVCTVHLQCCRKKTCLQCYTKVQKCPYCREDLSN